MKEKWEELKKSISINPQGNRVRFVPIVPNNRLNSSPSNSSGRLLFKPFVPKHIAICSGKENINSIQHKNDVGNQNITPVSHGETSLYPLRPCLKNPRSVSLQVSQSLQELKINTSTSFEKCSMDALENNLPKIPLRTLWTNDNNSKKFEKTISLKNNTFRKPFMLPSLNCSSQNTPSTNYVLPSKFQNKEQVLPTSNPVMNSRYFKSYSLSTSENLNCSFFTSDIEGSSASSHSVDSLEQNSSSCLNKPFNIDDIWKNSVSKSQLPKM